MAFFRQYIAPLFIFLIFIVALAFVSSRIFLPADMAAPAPIEVPAADNAQVLPDQQAALDNTKNAQIAPPKDTVADIEKAQTTPTQDTVADLPPSLSTLVKGLPDDSIGQL